MNEFKLCSEIGLKSIEWVVDQIISPGLTIIAGKSKIGKSWLVLWLSNAVEFGLDFLGRTCAKGDVLHYSLEDGKKKKKNDIFVFPFI